jgi:hypothetical protein
MSLSSGLLRRLVVLFFVLPGCGGTETGAARSGADSVPADWGFQDSKAADDFFGKGPRVRMFVGGPPAMYGTLNDPGALIPLNAQAIGYCGWKEDDDTVYAARFEQAAAFAHLGAKTPAERVNRVATLVAGYAHLRWAVHENRRRDVDHQGRPGCEVEYAPSGADNAKLSLSIVARIVYIEEDGSVCFMQVSSRKPGPALRAGDPKVRAFLTRSEIVIPKKANPGKD